MVKLLLSYSDGNEISPSERFYRIEYSSKEKFVNEFNKAGQDAIDKKQYSFLFLNKRFFLQEFDYGYYDDDYEKEKFDISMKVKTLDEFFNSSNVLVEGAESSKVVIEPLRSKGDAESKKFRIIFSDGKVMEIYHSNKNILQEALLFNAKKAKSQGEIDFEFFGLKIKVDGILNQGNEKENYQIEEI